MVIVGNGNGIGGWGVGRALDSQNAIQKATRDAIKNQIRVERFDNRTIYTDMNYTFQSVTLEMRTVPAGYGVVSNECTHEICRVLGITDLYCKIRGSKNPMNVVKATFLALASMRTPEVIAKMRGTKIEEVETIYYGKKI